MRVTAEVGTSVPLTSGATAKTILAFQPAAAIDAVGVAAGAAGPGTLTDPKTIREQLAQIAQRGWGFS